MTYPDLLSLLPALILCGWACIVMLADLAIPTERKALTGWLTLVGVGAAGASLILWYQRGALRGFNGLIAADPYALALVALLLLSAALAILLALNYLPRHNLARGEFYVLLLFSTAGMVLLTQATDLILVFLALELLSIPLYVLTGFARPRLASEEAALKYFLLGAFATGFIVYGTALVYGATGSTQFGSILAAVTNAKASPGLLVVGGGLILVGFGFKVGLVPFHMWTPDVYEGAPTAVTAFMAAGAKIAGFAALLRLVLMAVPGQAWHWAGLAALLATLTMILGNFAALRQTNLKRLLAYSSIAHAGYILMGMVAAGGTSGLIETATGATVFYLIAYALTSFGAWAVIMTVERQDGAGLQLEDYAGLGHRQPLLAAAMAVFMFSLTGLPPTVGFWAKFYVFRAALEGGYVWLVLVGVITALVSAYYYLRVIAVMYIQPGEGALPVAPITRAVVALIGLAVLILGVLPAPLLALAQLAGMTFGP